MTRDSYQEVRTMNIANIGWAIVFQSLLKYAACLFALWLVLSFANVWVMAWLGAAQ